MSSIETSRNSFISSTLDTISENIVLVAANADPMIVIQADLPPKLTSSISYNPVTALNFLPSERINCKTPGVFLQKIDKLYKERLDEYIESLQEGHVHFLKKTGSSHFPKLLEKVQIGSLLGGVTAIFLSLVSGGTLVSISWAAIGLVSGRVTSKVIQNSKMQKFNSISLETAAKIYGTEILHAMETINDANLEIKRIESEIHLDNRSSMQDELAQISSIRDYFLAMTKEAVEKMNQYGAKKGMVERLNNNNVRVIENKSNNAFVAESDASRINNSEVEIHLTSYNPLTLLEALPSQRVGCRDPGDFLQSLDRHFQERIIFYKMSLEEASKTHIRLDTTELYSTAINNIRVGGVVCGVTTFFLSFMARGVFGSLVVGTWGALQGVHIGNTKTLLDIDVDKNILVNALAEIYGTELLCALQIMKEADNEIKKLEKKSTSLDNPEQIGCLKKELEQITSIKNYFTEMTKTAWKEMSLAGALEGIYETLDISNPYRYGSFKEKDLKNQLQFALQIQKQ